MLIFTSRVDGRSVCIAFYPAMCVITISDCGMDIPESHCDSCDMRFNLCWNGNPVYDKPEYCPFCGDEIEEVINETDGDQAG